MNAANTVAVSNRTGIIKRIQGFMEGVEYRSLRFRPLANSKENMRVYRNGVDMVADSLVGIKKTLNNGELDKLLPLVRSFGILSTVCLEMRLMAVAANNRVPKRLHSDYCTNADCEMKKLDRRFNQALDDLTETLAVHEDILTIEQYANGKEIR